MNTQKGIMSFEIHILQLLATTLTTINTISILTGEDHFLHIILYLIVNFSVSSWWVRLFPGSFWRQGRAMITVPIGQKNGL
jgi:hypothetical protein